MELVALDVDHGILRASRQHEADIDERAERQSDASRVQQQPIPPDSQELQMRMPPGEDPC